MQTSSHDGKGSRLGPTQLKNVAEGLKAKYEALYTDSAKTTLDDKTASKDDNLSPKDEKRALHIAYTLASWMLHKSKVVLKHAIEQIRAYKVSKDPVHKKAVSILIEANREQVELQKQKELEQSRENVGKAMDQQDAEKGVSDD
jgi:hypothetical protein